MFFPPELGTSFLQAIAPILEARGPDHLRARDAWALMSGLQGVVVSKMLLNKLGNKVQSGPFKGMELTPEAMQGHFGPALLGCYEWELHETIERIIAQPYQQILNIGCSYGYYSVGLAQRMPQVKVYSFDINPEARNRCTKMAEVNGVAERVIIGELFRGEDFARFAGPKTLVLMDIEGGEKELLDPETYPALRQMDVIVEMHDCYDPMISPTLLNRCMPFYGIDFIRNRPYTYPLETVLGPDYIPDHFDNLLATWDGRNGPTPWAVMHRKT